MGFFGGRWLESCEDRPQQRRGCDAAQPAAASFLRGHCRDHRPARHSAPAAQRRVVIGLLVFAAANGVFLNLLFRLTLDLPTTLGTSAYALFAATPSIDSWKPMLRAVEAVHQPTGPLYQTVFFEESVKFQYPPTALLPLEILRALSEFEPRFMSYSFLNLASWPAFIGTIVVSGAILFRCLTNCCQLAIAGNRQQTTLVVVAVLIFGFTFYPLVRSYGLGQVQTWIDFFVAALLLAWLAGRRALPGSLAGLCCLIKPQFALLFAWAVIRKEWWFVLGGLAVVVPILGISIAAYGIDNHLDYLKVLSFIGQHGEAYFPNQSVNGLLNRLLFNGNNLDWQAHLFAPYHPVVHIATVATSVLIIGLALLWGYREHARASAIDLCIVLLGVTIAAPVAWEHHYGILLPIFALTFPATLTVPELGRYRLAILMVAFVLSSNLLSVTDQLADTRFNFLQSYLFLAAALLLWHLFRLRRAVAWRHDREAGLAVSAAGVRYG